MSFATGIKSELLRIENKKSCCARAELCGILCYSGFVTESPARKSLKIATENAASARRFFSLLKSCFGIAGTLFTNHSRGGGNAYGILVDSGAHIDTILEGLSLGSAAEGIHYRIPANIFEKTCCARAFLRGAFLGGGSITNPEKEYHLEFSSTKEALAADMVKLFAIFDLAARVVQRKTSFVTYFKSSSEIGDVLNIIGARTSYMDLMNVCIMKETRNNVNRKVNCETANMDKTINAAMEQIRAIHRLQKSGRFESLPLHLQETGLARLSAPEASMTELGQMMKVSKSGINHRMRRLMQMAEDRKG
ncbi:MAG: DNA-binding protein WhiA [Clostridia bacterium]|nr:DNA-binding protein WhiA [Clostridia bacterium]